MKIGVVGLGLIGGSLARQIMRNTSHTVLAYDISDEVLKKGALLNAYHDLLDLDAPTIDVDILIIATNPNVILVFIVEINQSRLVVFKIKFFFCHGTNDGH